MSTKKIAVPTKKSGGVRLLLSAAASLLSPCLLIPQAFAETSAASELELGTVHVKDVADSTGTENSGSYTSRQISIGKAPLSIRETPHSVSVITRQRLDDQNLNTVSDAIKYATGVTVQRFDGAGLFNNYYVRGYQIDAIQLDGLPIGSVGNVTEIDAAIYDRIEILRGPAGLYQGAGEPGGAVNLARKHALKEAQVKGAVSAGSWDAYRLELDATTALNGSGSLRGRAVAVAEDRDSYQDVINSKKRTLYGTLEYDLDDSTTLSVGATRQEIDSVIDQGLPTFADGSLPKVSRSTFIGADWNKLEPDTTDIFAELEHRLGNGGQLKLAVRHVDRNMLYRVARGNSSISNNGNIAIQTGLYTWDRENWSVDAYANMPFEAFGRTHNVIAGADWRKQNELAKSSPFANTATLNIFNIDHSIAQPNFTYNSFTGTETEQSGVYSQLRLQAVDALSVIFGGRLSWWQSSTTNRVAHTSTQYDANQEFTPYAALVYDISKQLSLYTSYADIFQAQNATKESGEQIKPRTGKQYEAGLKGEFAGGLLNTQLAVFRIQDENRAITDPNNALFSIAAGEVRSQGWEFEVSGMLAPGWDMTLGYTRVDTEYIKSTAAQEGQVFAPFTPRHSASLWTHYSFANGTWEGFSIGGGVRAVSSFYNQSGNTKIIADGYTIASAQLGYQFNSRWSANLTANNLFDKVYYEKVSTFGRQNFYGEPRSLTLAVKASLF